MAIIVRFRLRPPMPGKAYSNPNPIQVRITVDGQSDPGFTTGQKIDPALWDQSSQTTIGRSDAAQRVQRELTQIRADLERIYRVQQDAYQGGLGEKPDCASVKRQYQASRTVQPQASPVRIPIRQAMRQYVQFLRQNQRMADGLDSTTIRAYERNTEFLSLYLVERNQREPDVSELTVFWMEQYRRYLYSRTGLKRKHKTLSLSTCNGICYQIGKATAWLCRSGQIRVDPLAGMKLSAGEKKPVTFLDTTHINRLWSLTVKRAQAPSLWWTKLMVLTGLDYPDAQRYAFNRSQYESLTPGGKRKIVIRRSKPPRNECHIPYIKELDMLFAEGVPRPPIRMTLWRHLKKFETAIEYPDGLSAKICRKTAGQVFILKGLSVKGVSNVLGHSTVAVTEKHYVKITGRTVDLETDQLDF